MEDKANSMDETMKEKNMNPDAEVETEETCELETDEAVEEDYSENDSEVESEDGKEDQKTGKSFFKKDKKEKKDKKDLKIEELNDKLIRNMAEFDNFRKRSEREKSQMFEVGARDIIEKILPVIDNFERGLGTITEEEKESAFAQGIEKIYRQMFSSLSDAGLKPIDAVGKPFDPNFHNAVMHAEDPEQGENLVAEEFQKGYTYRDTIIRHSMVKVVN